MKAGNCSSYLTPSLEFIYAAGVALKSREKNKNAVGVLLEITLTL